MCLVQVRVCANDPSLEISDSQAVVFKDIMKYVHGAAAGSMLASLCCLVWLILVIREIGYGAQLIVASVHLRGRETKFSDNCVKMLSTARVAWFVCVQMTRVAIAACLGGAGVRFLSVTVSLESLLRTTVALSFIMGLDELFHSTLNPKQLKKVRNDVKELVAVPSLPTFNGLDLATVLKFLTTVCCFFFSVFILIVPEHDKLVAVGDALCGTHACALHPVYVCA